MRALALLLVGCGCIACSSNDDAGSCSDMGKKLTARHGSCTIDPTGTFPGGSACPFIDDAYCGDETSCPAGWSLGCVGSSPDPDGSGTDCTYGLGGDNCTLVDAMHVTIAEIQTLDGVDGVAVVIDQAAGQCAFRACD